MPLVLVRIDDRLIHGQVVVGWGMYLNPDRIILSSDTIANSPWEKELYYSAEATAPYPLTISVLSHNETIGFLDSNILEKEKIILVVESPQELLLLIQKGLKIDRVNVGGMHYKHGKRKITNFIFVDDEDISSFKELTRMKVYLEGRDVPNAREIDISQVVESLT